MNMNDNESRVRAWMAENLANFNYEDPFDLAVDCAYDLDLCEMCEINGDKTFIPIYIQQIAATFFPPLSSQPK